MAEYSNAAFTSRPRRRPWTWLVGLAAVLLAVAAGAYTLYWYGAAEIAKEAFAVWADDRRDEGFTVDYGDVEVTGFPFSFQVRIGQPAFGQAFVPAWTWRTEQLTARARPWSPNRFTITAAADHDVEYTARGVRQRARAYSSDMRFDVVLRGGVVERVTARSRDLRIAVEGLTGSFGAARIDIRYQVDGIGAGGVRGPSLALAATEIVLPFDELENLGIGGRIARFGAAATLTGPLTAGPFDRAVTAWRDGGGAININTLRLEWGDLRLDGDGTIALDDSFRPIGALTTRVLGVSETINALRDAGTLSPREAAIARITLRVLAGASEGGKMLLPVTAQFGKLYVGPVAVLEIPPLIVPARRPPPRD